MDVIVNQTYSSPKNVIWKALTDLSQMKMWYFNNIPEFKAQPGFKTQFDVQSENRVFHHQWEVLEVIPDEKITLSWTYRDIEGYSTVTFLLSESGDQTELTVTCKGLDSFPEDIPEFKPESCTAGWKYFLNELDLFLADRS